MHACLGDKTILKWSRHQPVWGFMHISETAFTILVSVHTVFKNYCTKCVLFQAWKVQEKWQNYWKLGIA